MYILGTNKNFKLKHRLPYKSIDELVVTAETDNLLIVRISPELKKDKVRTSNLFIMDFTEKIRCECNFILFKGDLILEVPHIIEALTLAIDITKNNDIVNIVNTDS